MKQVSGDKGGVLVKSLNFEIELIEGCAKRTRQTVIVRQQRGPVRSEDAKVELCIKEGDFQPITGRGVAVRLRDAMDQTLETQPAKIVGHLRGGVRAAEESFDVGPEIAVAKAVREMGEGRRGPGRAP